jgi:hypothetical protein
MSEHHHNIGCVSAPDFMRIDTGEGCHFVYGSSPTIDDKGNVHHPRPCENAPTWKILTQFGHLVNDEKYKEILTCDEHKGELSRYHEHWGQIKVEAL